MTAPASTLAYQAALDAVLKTAKDNPKLAKPAYIDGWSIATDGRRLFATVALTVDGIPDGFPVGCRNWIEAQHGTIVDAEKFCAFVGEPRKAIECDDCYGSGSVSCSCPKCGDDHDSDCDRCDGTGLRGPKNRLIRIGPALVNAYILADVLTALQPKGVLMVHTTAEDRCEISQESWRLIFMPMNQKTTEGGEDAPRWEEYV